MKKLSSLVNFDLPFVVYKLPHSSRVQLLQQNTTELFTDKDLKQEGFYFAPYDFDKHPVLILPVQSSSQSDYLLRDFQTTSSSFSLSVLTDENEANQHQQKVAKAVRLIKQNKLEKLIISRRIKVSVNNFNSLDALLSLMRNRDESFVYLWHHPQVGTWLGATPELMANYQDETFQTVALAGTLPVDQNTPVNWSIKEINEQKIVSDYIEKQLKNFTDQVIVEKPKTVYQGSIAHIKNELSAKILHKDLSNLIKKLHPTPAVCGMPTDIAKKYISEIEDYDRKYYTGFLGIKSPQKLQFYVNLRCLEVYDKQLCLYVGGGIVADSIPEKEWQETIYKSDVLLQNFDIK